LLESEVKLESRARTESTPRRRYLDRFPALVDRSRRDSALILAAVREWYPHAPIEEIPAEAWELFLQADRHDRTTREVGDELAIRSDDVAAALRRLDEPGDEL
jgi:hypothetical protein